MGFGWALGGLRVGFYYFASTDRLLVRFLYVLYVTFLLILLAVGIWWESGVVTVGFW